VAKMSSESNKKYSVNVGVGSIQCFTLNSADNKVIVAGKTECELITMDERKFLTSSGILKKKLIGSCIMDISWSRLDGK
jgi:hypothetical protein